MPIRRPLPNQQNLIDRSLGEAGLQRRVAVHLPYFLAAIRMLETTDLVLTMPARIGEPVPALFDLPRMKAPQEIPPYDTRWSGTHPSIPICYTLGFEKQCVRSFVLLLASKLVPRSVRPAKAGMNSG